ncbi:MAG: hypothetical protein ACRDBO_19700 [Lachnospiraceae bacterium]
MINLLEQQQIVESALLRSIEYERQLAGEELSTMLEGCKEKGMTVNEVDKEPFIQAVQPVYEKYDSQFGDIFNKIKSVN